jgi:hypothetical protein
LLESVDAEVEEAAADFDLASLPALFEVLFADEEDSLETLPY